MRHRWLVTAITVCVAVPSAASEPSGADAKRLCLSNICLGDKISSINRIAWIDPYETGARISRARLRDRAFPVYGILRDPVTETFHRSHIEQSLKAMTNDLPRPRRDPAKEKRSFLDAIKGVSDPEKLWASVEKSSFADAMDLKPPAMPLIASDGLVFCKPQRFAAYFGSKSGHPTTVGFRPVALEPDKHVLIVDFLARSFKMERRAGKAFYEKLKQRYPSVVSTDDLRVKCPAKGLLIGLCELGQREYPTKFAAAERMFLRGRDQLAYYTPPSVRGAKLELQLFDPHSFWFEMVRKTSRPTLPKIKNRFPPIRLFSHPMCQEPPASVPSLD